MASDPPDRARIVVCDPDPAWALTFARLRDAIAPALEGVALAIEHVGSTAVPGLAAKPVIDMDVVVEQGAGVARAVRALEGLGYVHRGDLGIAGREAFRAPPELPRHHLYVCVQGCAALRNHLAVRDHLRAHPEQARAYGELKRELARVHAFDMDAYVEGKSAFLQRVLRASGFDAEELERIERANAREQPGARD